MSSDSEGQGSADEENRRGKGRGNDNNTSPQTWQRPSMDMLDKTEGDRSAISSESITALSGISKGTAPPPIPPKTFKRKQYSVHVETENTNIEKDAEYQNMQELLGKTELTRDISPERTTLTVKDKSKMFEQSVQDSESNSHTAFPPVDTEQPRHRQNESIVGSSSDLMKDMEEKQKELRHNVDKTECTLDVAREGYTGIKASQHSQGNIGHADGSFQLEQHHHPRFPGSAQEWPVTNTPTVPQGEREPLRAHEYISPPVPFSQLPSARDMNTTHAYPHQAYNQFDYDYKHGQFGDQHPKFGPTIPTSQGVHSQLRYGTQHNVLPKSGYDNPSCAHQPFDLGMTHGAPHHFGHAKLVVGPQQFSYATPGGGPQQLGDATLGDLSQQLGNVAQGSSPRQFGHAAPSGGPQQFGQAAQGGGPQQFGHPAQGDGPQQFGHPAPSGGPQQFGQAAQGGGPQQFGHPAQGRVPQQFGYASPGSGPQQFGHGSPGGGSQQFSHAAQGGWSQQFGQVVPGGGPQQFGHAAPGGGPHQFNYAAPGGGPQQFIHAAPGGGPQQSGNAAQGSGSQQFGHAAPGGGPQQFGHPVTGGGPQQYSHASPGGAPQRFGHVAPDVGSQQLGHVASGAGPQQFCYLTQGGVSQRFGHTAPGVYVTTGDDVPGMPGGDPQEFGHGTSGISPQQYSHNISPQQVTYDTEEYNTNQLLPAKTQHPGSIFSRPYQEQHGQDIDPERKKSDSEEESPRPQTEKKAQNRHCDDNPEMNRSKDLEGEQKKPTKPKKPFFPPKIRNIFKFKNKKHDSKILPPPTEEKSQSSLPPPPQAEAPLPLRSKPPPLPPPPPPPGKPALLPEKLPTQLPETRPLPPRPPPPPAPLDTYIQMPPTTNAPTLPPTSSMVAPRSSPVASVLDCNDYEELGDVRRPMKGTSTQASRTQTKSPKSVDRSEKQSFQTKEKKLKSEHGETDKMYVCVSGIGNDDSDETVINYLEARSKMDIISDELIRTEDKQDHGIIVFKEKIDMNDLQRACDSKKLTGRSLTFEELDPPRSLIYSSKDELTVESVKAYLSGKNMQTVRVYETDDGSISVKMKNLHDVKEILKSTNIEIDGANVVVSIMYNCDHGTFWDHSKHRVAIPAPYQPTVLDRHVKSFITDIKAKCNERLEKHHARLSFADEIRIECTLDPKDKQARQKVKTWKENVVKAWDEFVTGNAHKKDLKITHDVKDKMVEHINTTKDRHTSEELKVIHDEDSLTIIFVGKSEIVENFHDQMSTKKVEIQENFKRQKRIKTESLKVKPIEIALMLKENIFDQFDEIGLDFKHEVDKENGKISLTGVEEDKAKAKLKILEVKNKYHSWTIKKLSPGQCRLLANEQVVGKVYQNLSDDNIPIVFELGQGQVVVCITNQDHRKRVEDVFKDIVKEEVVQLDSKSKNIIGSKEWDEKKAVMTNFYRGIVDIDDSGNKGKIAVAAIDDVLKQIIDDLEQFIDDNSIYQETIKIKDVGEYDYLKMHCKNWVKDLEFKNSDQRLQIQFVNQVVEISGTKKAITSAMSEVNSQIPKIKNDKHSIRKPGVESLFKDKNQCADIIGPIEDESKTVILVHDISKLPSHGNKGHQEQEKDYQLRVQASEHYKRKDAKQTPDVTLQSGAVVYRNGTNVTLVKKQDLGQQKVNVIICSTNRQLDLTGPAGKSMVKVAGKQILDEIQQKYSNGIQHGEIAVVKGYKLQCTEVYLAALPGWRSGGEKIIQKCVNTCLTKASKYMYKSIVFPALGTGGLNYPRELVAEIMFQCVEKFDQSNSSLKDIKFLCYDDDTIKAFEKEESKIKNTGIHPSAGPSSAGHHITTTNVKGDLGSQQVDVMVTAVRKDLNLERSGGAGISILKGLGQSIQKDIINQHPNGVSSGGFAAVQLSSPVGKCKAVYLTSLDSWDQEKKVKDSDKQICKFVYKCLEQAEKDGYKCIAIPAMGTGRIGYPHDKVAACMYDQVETFASNNQQSRLTDVKFVVHDKDTIQAFYDEEKKRIPPPTPQRTGAYGYATGGTSPSTDVSVKSVGDNAFQVGSIKFVVEQGDILAKRCDAIVNGSNEKLDLNYGAVSQAIKKRCDPKTLDAEIAKKKDEMKQLGLVTTSGCGLPANYIIHISSKRKLYEWKNIIKKAVYEAEKNQLKTMAFPALGTGRGIDEEQMGKVIMESVIEFVSEGQFSHLQHVYLVIFNAKMMTSMLKGVRSAGQATLSTEGPNQVLKSTNQHECTVTFWIYSMSLQDVENAKQKLNASVAEKFKTENVHDNLICELRPYEISYLQSLETKHPINMTIDPIKKEVIIEGIIEYATNAKQDVFDCLRKFSFRRHCEAEAEIITEQVQWYYKEQDYNTGVMSLNDYPPMINMEIENVFKGDSKQSKVNIKDAEGEEYIIDLKTMTEYPVKTPTEKIEVIRREKLKGTGATFEPPPEWGDQGTENVKVVTLINGSPEYKSVEKKLVDSVKNGKFAKTSPDVIGKTVTVIRIERIQNLNLYRMYAAKRAFMQKQNPNVKNEQELWHGTPESAVVSINLYGFNRSYCTENSKGAWWGQGVYFANDASYSVRDFLARPGASNEKSIYLCLVLTGVTRKGTKNEELRVLPTRQDGSMLPYDSNTDDLNPPLEYVVFNDTQAYPLYRIKFTLK